MKLLLLLCLTSVSLLAQTSDTGFTPIFGKSSSVLCKTDSIKSLPVKNQNIIGKWEIISQFGTDRASGEIIKVIEDAKKTIEFSSNRSFKINSEPSNTLWDFIKKDTISFYEKVDANNCEKGTLFFKVKSLSKNKLVLELYNTKFRSETEVYFGKLTCTLKRRKD